MLHTPRLSQNYWSCCQVPDLPAEQAPACYTHFKQAFLLYYLYPQIQAWAFYTKQNIKIFFSLFLRIKRNIIMGIKRSRIYPDCHNKIMTPLEYVIVKNVL